MHVHLHVVAVVWLWLWLWLWAVASAGRREADGEPLALGGRSRVSESEVLLPMLCMSAFFSSFPLSLMMRS
jgi:hypothetical protein